MPAVKGRSAEQARADLPKPQRGQLTIALLAILVCALSLRAPLTGLSPISGEIFADLGVPLLVIGYIGSAGPLLLALTAMMSGYLMAVLSQRLLAISATALLALAIIGRSLAWDGTAFVLSAALVYVAIGILNAVMPAFIGTRFGVSQVPLVTALYASVIAVGTSIAPLLARWSVETSSWRLSSALWAVAAGSACVLIAATKQPNRPASALGAQRNRRRTRPSPRTRPSGDLIRITLLFAITAFNAFAMFAWLPRILLDRNGVGASQSAWLLAIYALMAVPVGLVTPLLLRKRSRFTSVALAGLLCFVVGYVFLSTGYVWAPLAGVIIGGCGQLLYSAGLVKIADLERESKVSGISGKVQGIGFALGSLGPVVTSALYELDGTGTTVCLLLAVLPSAALLILRRSKKAIPGK